MELTSIILLILAIICFAGGILGCVLPILPGPPFCYIAMQILHWGDIVSYSISTLVIWAVITLIVTVVDFFLTPYMTKKFGGSKAGNYGAIIGLVVGIFLPWPIGPLIGPFAGAFIGEIIFSKRNSSEATISALGAFLSFFVGTGIKLIACIGMILNTLL